MEYITYKRFKGKGIAGSFNLSFGTIVTETGGWLHAPDGRQICAVTSENGWSHFRPATPTGKRRQAMLNALFDWYLKHGLGEDFSDEKWPDQENAYWKNRLRTASTERLEQIYADKIGGNSCM